MRYDAIIIGGGAAGLFCAITAGKRGRRVLVVEHNAEVGRKIIISGGGRCNFTNLNVSADNFISKNPHFAKSALAGFTPEDFIRLVKAHGIAFYEKKLGQLFCRGSSRQIVDMLLEECRHARVEVRTGLTVSSVSNGNGGFDFATNQGHLRSAKLIVACGGLSFPKVGATDLGYRIAKQFGVKVEPTRPSLVALVCEREPMPDLAGISMDAVVSTPEQEFRENILFTHRGLSGPAILQISNYWRRDEPIIIDLFREQELVDLLESGPSSQKTLGNVLSAAVPSRVVERLIDPRLAGKKVMQLTVEDRAAVVAYLSRWQVKFRETEGWDRAEVTLGGVSTDDLESKTMECRRVPGLYFIGEVVDVTGWLGGYNFQWAWASAFAAGNAV